MEKVKGQKTKFKYKTRWYQTSFGKFLCWLLGHPQGGNIFITSMDTYCPRCGRKNLQ